MLLFSVGQDKNVHLNETPGAQSLRILADFGPRQEACLMKAQQGLKVGKHCTNLRIICL